MVHPTRLLVPGSLVALLASPALPVPVGAEFVINSSTTGRQSSASVTMDSSGGFVVVWQSYGKDGSQEAVVGQRYAPTATPTPTPTDTPTPTPTDTPTNTPTATATPTNTPVPLAVADVDGDGEVEALTDGLLLLRYFFGFRDAVLIAGAVDTVDCTRCTAQAIEGYIAGLL